jgi:hypothetical protein
MKMKVEEIFDKVAPMVEQLELDQDTALLMLGTDERKNCGAIIGNGRTMIAMIVEQMLREKKIELVIMKAAEAFINVIEEEANNAKDKQQKLS